MKEKPFYALLIPLLALCLGAFIYQNALRAPFQFDDFFTITENPSIKSLDFVDWVWTWDPSRFLTYFSFALNYYFGGLDPFGYHIFNICIHFLTSVVFFIFLKLTLFDALEYRYKKNELTTLCILASFIFLCHPIQTSAVTYVSQRSTLLASLFYLSCLVFYISFRKKGHKRYYVYALFCAIAGLFTKPIIITLPFALILYEKFFLGFSFKKHKKIILGLLPFLFLAVAVPLLLLLWKYKSLDTAQWFEITRETIKISRKDYLLTQFNVLRTYLRLLILPINQNLDYDYPIAHHLVSFPTYFSFLALMLIFYFAIRIYKTHRVISFCILWFFLTLSLESSVFPISDVIFEHRLYLPMAGFALILPLTIKMLVKDKRLFIPIMCILVGVFSIAAHRRNNVWNDRIGLLLDVARKSPNKARVHNNLAVAYNDTGKPKEAEMEYKKAIALNVKDVDAYNNLGIIFADQGKTEEALSCFKRAIAIKPTYEAPYYNLGHLYKNLNDLEKSEENYRKAIELKSYFAPAYVALAKIYIIRKRYDLAKFLARQAIYSNPDYGYAYLLLGDIYAQERNYPLAIEEYHKTILKQPDLVKAYNNLANIHDMHGRFHVAIKVYQTAIEVDPYFADPYFNLANTLMRLGRLNESIKNLRIALSIYKRENNAYMIKRTQNRLQEVMRAQVSIPPK